MSLTSTAKPCGLDKLKGSTLPRLPTPKLSGSTRKDISKVSTKLSPPKHCLNQSTLSLPMKGLTVKTADNSCHKGSKNFPECITGLHLLVEDEQTDVAETSYTNSSYFSLENIRLPGHKSGDRSKDKKYQPHSIVLAVLIMFCVSWLKENNMLSPAFLSSCWSWLKESTNLPRKSVMDQDGNLTVGSLKVTTDKLGHG